MKERKIYIEILRIIACFCVIFTHTMEKGYFLFSLFPPNSVKYWSYMMVSVLVKAAVPMFFAISGALLIAKKESIAEVYKNRIVKIIIVLVLFSFLYYCRSIVYNFREFSIGNFINELIISNWNFTFWYLYAFIAFLISLPLLRVLANNMKTVDFYYLFLCIILYKACVPIVEYVLWNGSETINSSIRTIWFNADIFIYPILGYFLEHKIEIQTAKRWIVPLWIINILSIVLTCVLTNYKVKITGECSESKSQTFFSCFSMINVATTYMTIKYAICKVRLKEIYKKWISSLGEATFGIYLLHLLFLQQLPIIPKVWNILERIIGSNSMLVAFVVCLIVMGISYVVTIIMKRISFLRKLL